MPARGVEVIDGIPVYLKGNVIYAFRHEAVPGQPDLSLGIYTTETKKPIWNLNRPEVNMWLQEFRANLGTRSRK
jgi:hypothetical protein